MSPTTILLFMGFPCLIRALNCDREFNYYEQYGKNGFDIVCTGITKGYEDLLANLAIFNEMTLTIKDSSFENATQNLFNNVRNIKYLNVVNSTFTFPSGHQIFKRLAELEHLAFESTEINLSDTTFKGLIRLKQLSLNDNNISLIHKKSFSPLQKVSMVSIVNNKLKRLVDIPLCELENLKQINLENNLLYDIKFDFFLCKRRAPGRIAVRLNGNTQDVYVQDNFYSMEDDVFELFEINFKNNKIVHIGNALEDVDTLKYLNFEGNLIKSLENVTFKHLDNLVSVTLSNNSIASLDKNFDNKLHLKYLNLQYNQLQFIKIANVPKLQYLNLAYNHISRVTLVHTTVLDTLIMHDNKLEPIDLEFFKYLENLVTLDLSNNHNISFSGSSFTRLQNLKNLYISGCNLSVLPELLFRPLKNLKVLNISRNNFMSLTPNTLFQSLVKLEQLNISYNKIEHIDYAVLEPLKNLKVLDVAGNMLRNIQYDMIISNLPSISVLNIKSNLLSCEILVEIIKFLKKKNIGYTASEHFDYDYTKENVAGIYCSNSRGAANTNPMAHGGSHVLFNFIVVLIIVLVSIIITILLFKIYVYLKRRNYKADEFELVQDK